MNQFSFLLTIPPPRGNFNPPFFGERAQGLHLTPIAELLNQITLSPRDRPLEPEWRDVPNYEGCYEVSSDGQVRRSPRCRAWGRGVPGRVLKPRPLQKGYLAVSLHRGSEKAKGMSVHQLVARAFLGEPPFRNAQVNHKDGVKTHNHVSNLEWVTYQGNIDHARSLGLMAINERASKAKLKNADVPKIREMLGQGIKTPEVARRFNVSMHTIRSLKYGHTWRNLQ